LLRFTSRRQAVRRDDMLKTFLICSSGMLLVERRPVNRPF
jgi:hypothetical protein